jgi:type IV fimbrial biogenesis protein FimT
VLRGRHNRAAGFTLIEVVVALTIFSILVAAGVPTFRSWVANTKVRATADSLQNGVRVAQSEALRRSRQVVFSLTNSAAPQTSLTAVANGANWSINTISALAGGGDAAFVQSGVLTATNSNVAITGPAEICFNSLGRLVGNSSTGVAGGTCALPTGTPPQAIYNITATGLADHPLRVWVGLGGQVHMCDPSKTLSSANPDGC